MSDLSFVLPLAVEPGRSTDDLERARRILLPSLAKFLGPDIRPHLEVVVPVAGLERTRQALAPFSRRLSLGVVPEDDILLGVEGWKRPGAFARLARPLKKADLRWNRGRFFAFAGAPAGWDALDGWRRQQLIKLLWWRRSRSPFYVTLDADVCLTRPAAFGDFLPEGRAIYTAVPVHAHAAWWRGSASTLGIEARLAESDLAFGVTPAILAAEVVGGLVERLRARAQADGGRSLFEYLASRDNWTEYTLYWLFLLELGRREDLYRDDGPVNLRHRRLCVWERRLAPDLAAVCSRVEAAFRDPTSLFLVVQSSCVPLGESLDAFSGHLE